MKKFFCIVLLLLILFATLFFVLKIYLLKPAVEKGIAYATGLSCKLNSIDLNLSNTYIDINSISLGNPPDFSENKMFFAPQIYADYDFNTLLKGDVRIEFARINISEFNIEKNRNGELNINILREKDTKETKTKSIAKKTDVSVDSLKLIVRKVTYTDYSVGGEPLVKEYNINLDETFSNITGIKPLLNLIVYKLLTMTNIASLAGIDVSAYKAELSESLQKQIESAPAKIQELIPLKLDNDTTDNESGSNPVKNIIGANMPAVPTPQENQQ